MKMFEVERDVFIGVENEAAGERERFFQIERGGDSGRAAQRDEFRFYVNGGAAQNRAAFGNIFLNVALKNTYVPFR